MKINGKFFKDAIHDKRLSIRGVATMLGMNHHSQLSLTLSGKRRMQLDEAIEISKILGLPLNEVIANAGFPEVLQNGHRVPVIGILRGNGEVENIPAKTERAIAPAELPDNTRAVQARTPDTQLAWMDRWVFFCAEPTEPTDAMMGRFCLIKLKNGSSVIGTLHRGYEHDTYSITGPYSHENVKIEWAAPIIITRN